MEKMFLILVRNGQQTTHISILSNCIPKKNNTITQLHIYGIMQID